MRRAGCSGAGLGEGVDAEGPGAAAAGAPARGQPTAKSSSKRDQNLIKKPWPKKRNANPKCVLLNCSCCVTPGKEGKKNPHRKKGGGRSTQNLGRNGQTAATPPFTTPDLPWCERREEEQRERGWLHQRRGCDGGGCLRCCSCCC